jgi:hypothetical protein
MPRSSRLPTRFPVGTKYVLEGRGQFVRRYLEFPNGHRMHLTTRKALSCKCPAQQEQISIVPEVLDTQAFPRIFT